MSKRIVTLGEVMLRLKSPGFERFFQLLGEFQQLGSQEIPADGIEDQEIIISRVS